jgi:hypothetical protein
MLTLLGLAVVRSRLWPASSFRTIDLVNALACAAAFVLIYFYGELAYDSISGEFGHHAVQIGIAIVTIALGAFGHWFRSKNRVLYGLVEIAFGVAYAFSISQGLDPVKPAMSQIIALMGCAYIIARGFENLAKARAEAEAIQTRVSGQGRRA